LVGNLPLFERNIIKMAKYGFDADISVTKYKVRDSDRFRTLLIPKGNCARSE
jgi:hypothetical protein